MSMAQLSTSGLRTQTLYKGGDGGYFCYRIPTLVRTPAGTVLAIAEGRVDSCHDDGDIDLVLRRSTDDGATWSGISVVSSGNGRTHGNPAPVVDAATGRVVLLSTHNPPQCRTGCQRDPHVQWSEDDGRTWTPPQPLPDLRRPEWDVWYGTGPMHGIQLRHGRHAGRLVVGANWQSARSEPRQFGIHLVYSDDGGLTWSIGAVTTTPGVRDGEVTVVELRDGSVYALARAGRDGDPAAGTRAFALSEDQGESFTGEIEFLPELAMPDVQGALLRGHEPDGAILFSHPSHREVRRGLAIASSRDELRDIERAPVAVIHAGPAAYSDLVALAGNRYAVAYEAGETSAYEEIRLTEFTEADLARLAGPATTRGAQP